MTYHFIRHATLSPVVLSDIASLWNSNAVGRHAFFPWTVERLAELLDSGDRAPGVLITAHERDVCIGFAYCNQVREDGYPFAGVIENILVDAPHRRRGVGTELLRLGLSRIAEYRPALPMVDALGAWPYGYSFNCLADGSERSGVFLNDPATYRLFRRAKFEPVRKSIVMRASLAGARPRPIPRGAAFRIGKRPDRTWLDRVFRGRELWDHQLLRRGDILSRAIFGFMESESRQEGRAVFSVFGVNTPFDLQGNGYAGINLSHMMAYVRDLGAEVLELHVYADNAPALRLYSGLGFRAVAETMMMHRQS